MSLLLGATLVMCSTGLAQKASIAVTYLSSNTSNPEAAWISKGMADMLTTDLAKISSLTVVQREQLDKVLKEQALGASGAVDPGKASQLGKLLGAQQLVLGSYAAIGRNVRVDLQVVDTQSGKVNAGVSAEGSIDSIFTLEKQLVLALVTKLGVTPSAAEMQAIMQAETFNNQAVILNYQGLSQLQTDPKSAADKLRQAVNLDPNYRSAQQNLRIALNVSGQSLANAAVLDLESKGKELDVAWQVAHLLRDSLQITNFKFGEVRSGRDSWTNQALPSGVAAVKYTFDYGLKPGTLTAVAKLLAPYSRETSDRDTWQLNAPGVGRGDQVKLKLADDTIAAISTYLRFFQPYIAFYGTGKEPIYVRRINLKDYSYLVDFVMTQHAGMTSSAERELSLSDELEAPISLIRNMNAAEALLAADTRAALDYFKGGDTFLQLDARNASELKLPQGYIRQNGYACKMDVGSPFGSEFNVQHIQSFNKVTSFSGDCTIYTKIDDGDFNPEKLKTLVESGEDYSITYYNVGTRQFTTRKRRSLIVTDEFTFTFGDRKFNERVNLVYPQGSYYTIKKYEGRLPDPSLNVVIIQPLF